MQLRQAYSSDYKDKVRTRQFTLDWDIEVETIQKKLGDIEDKTYDKTKTVHEWNIFDEDPEVPFSIHDYKGDKWHVRCDPKDASKVYWILAELFPGRVWKY